MASSLCPLMPRSCSSGSNSSLAMNLATAISHTFRIGITMSCTVRSRFMRPPLCPNTYTAPTRYCPHHIFRNVFGARLPSFEPQLNSPRSQVPVIESQHRSRGIGSRSCFCYFRCAHGRGHQPEGSYTQLQMPTVVLGTHIEFDRYSLNPPVRLEVLFVV